MNKNKNFVQGIIGGGILQTVLNNYTLVGKFVTNKKSKILIDTIWKCDIKSPSTDWINASVH